jgi:hypothetical protein
MVSRDSAAPLSNIEGNFNHIHISADHSGIVKIQKPDHEYEKVYSAIAETIQKGKLVSRGGINLWLLT